MKKWFLLCALSALIFASCKKVTDTECKELAPTLVATSTEIAYLQNFLAANSITASEKNGVYYVISSQGTGISPNLCSNITLTYSGNLINGTTVGGLFDETPAGQTSTFGLSNLILGWKVIFPLIKAGGNVTLYIPPSLAYGDRVSPARPGFVGIPANSYLKFTVSLLGVQ